MSLTHQNYVQIRSHMLLLEKVEQQKNELNEQLLAKEQELTLLRNQFEESAEKVNRIKDLENQV